MKLISWSNVNKINNSFNNKEKIIDHIHQWAVILINKFQILSSAIYQAGLSREYEWKKLILNLLLIAIADKHKPIINATLFIWQSSNLNQFSYKIVGYYNNKSYLKKNKYKKSKYKKANNIKKSYKKKIF